MKLLKEVIDVRNMVLRKKNKKSFLSEFIAISQKKGKKHKVETSYLSLLRNIKKKKETKLISNFLENIILEVKPFIGLKAKKVGSSTYRIPISISITKEVSTGISWLVKESSGRKKGRLANMLQTEFEAAIQGQGAAIKKKKALHLLAETNRAFIKYLF